jgi:hypothetical protein
MLRNSSTPQQLKMAIKNYTILKAVPRESGGLNHRGQTFDANKTFEVTDELP